MSDRLSMHTEYIKKNRIFCTYFFHQKFILVCEFCSSILQSFSLAAVITEISSPLSLIKDAFMKQTVKDLSGCFVDRPFFFFEWLELQD